MGGVCPGLPFLVQLLVNIAALSCDAAFLPKRPLAEGHTKVYYAGLMCVSVRWTTLICALRMCRSSRTASKLGCHSAKTFPSSRSSTGSMKFGRRSRLTDWKPRWPDRPVAKHRMTATHSGVRYNHLGGRPGNPLVAIEGRIPLP